MISVLILTLDEEINLLKCLESIRWSDDIVVLDSYSNDRTTDIAKKFGARVVQRDFDNYASQSNAAVSKGSNDSNWIVVVDADEIVTPELKHEILHAVKSGDPSITMYRVRRKDMFQGKWIKQSSGYPTWFPRVFKNNCVSVEREINEEYF